MSTTNRPLALWSESWTEPRPVQFHFVRLDLAAADYEVRALVADDPDGTGPAEAALTDPLALARSRPGIAVAINANAFRPVPDADGKLDTNWHAGQPVDIAGLAVAGGVLRSSDEPERDAFWTDASRRARIGQSPDGADAATFTASAPAEGVGDWGARLLANGEIVAPGTLATHPRTLLGLDATGRWLLLVVADGRQPGVSEGLTLRESAQVLARHGCTDGLNLDGGGSSVLLLADDAASAPLHAPLHIANRPSGGSPRPVPVMLGIVRCR